MSKVLNMEELIYAAEQTCDASEVDTARQIIEEAADKLATMVAEALEVNYEPGSASFTDGGLYADFNPSEPGQECPSELEEGDPDGEWQFNQSGNRRASAGS